MNLKFIYKDKNLLVIDKPAGRDILAVINNLLKKFPELKKAGKPPRYGVVHRLDKDTSGVLLIAKNNQALIFLQKQFKQKTVLKKYLALIIGAIKPKRGVIDTLIGRMPNNRLKQKVFQSSSPEARTKGLRQAITSYQTIKEFKDYTLVEAMPKTGRKHQIRVHFSWLGHPIAGDRTYGFKNQSLPQGLTRQFLHAHYLEIILPNKKKKVLRSELPFDLKKALN